MASCFLTQKIVAILSKQLTLFSAFFHNPPTLRMRKIQPIASRSMQPSFKTMAPGLPWSGMMGQSGFAMIYKVGWRGGLEGGGSMLGAVLSLPKKIKETLFGVCNKNRDIERYEGIFGESFIYFCFGQHFMVAMVVFWLGHLPEFWFFAPFSEVLGAGEMGNICVVFKEVTSIGRMTSPKRRNRTNCKMLKESKWPGLGVGLAGWRDVDRDVTHTHTLIRYFLCDFVPFFWNIYLLLLLAMGIGIFSQSIYLEYAFLNEMRKLRNLCFPAPRNLGFGVVTNLFGG